MGFSSTRATSAALVRRLLVQENIHDDVVSRLQRRLSTLRLGDPLDKNTDIGAVNSQAQLERITEIANSGDDEGAIGGALPARFQPRVSGSRPQCLPMFTPVTGLPGKKFLARCSP